MSRGKLFSNVSEGCAIAHNRLIAYHIPLALADIKGVSFNGLSNFVGIFFEANSSICIVFISILCYYYLTESVWTEQARKLGNGEKIWLNTSSATSWCLHSSCRTRKFAQNSFSVFFRGRRSNPSLSQTTLKSRLRKPLLRVFCQSPCGWMFCSQRPQAELCHFHLHERPVWNGRSSLSISNDR